MVSILRGDSDHKVKKPPPTADFPHAHDLGELLDISSQIGWGDAEEADDVSAESPMSQLQPSAASVSAVSARDPAARSSRLYPPIGPPLIRDRPLSWIFTADSRTSSSIPPPKPAVRPFSTNRGPHVPPCDTPAGATSVRSSPCPKRPPSSTIERTVQKRGRIRAIDLLRGAAGARFRAASNSCARNPQVHFWRYSITFSRIVRSLFHFQRRALTPCPNSSRR